MSTFIRNTANVTATTHDPDLTNNTSTVDVDLEALADVAVRKSAPPTVSAGSDISFTILVTNYGPQTAANVVLTDAMSQFITNPRYSLDGGLIAPWTGSLNLGDIPIHIQHSITITGTIRPNAPATNLANTAVVSADTLDPDLTNNTSTTHTAVAAVADLALTKSASQLTVKPGDRLSYTLEITNFGPSTSQRVEVTDPLSQFLLDPTFTVNGIQQPDLWSGQFFLGDMAPNAVDTIVITATVAQNATGAIFNRADVGSFTFDPNLNNNFDSRTTPVAEESADVQIIKIASPTTVNPGDTLTYTLSVTNRGPDASHNVVVTDALPAGLLNPTFTVGDVPQGPWTGSYTVGTLAPNQASTIVITAQVDPNATIFFLNNTATVTAATPDPDLTNNTSTVRVRVLISQEEVLAEIIHSVAMQQLGLAHVLNAEGEKIQAIIGREDATVEEMLRANASVACLIGKVTSLEMLLLSKLETALGCNPCCVQPCDELQ